jgi:hypothetical protein
VITWSMVASRPTEIARSGPALRLSGGSFRPRLLLRWLRVMRHIYRRHARLLDRIVGGTLVGENSLTAHAPWPPISPTRRKRTAMLSQPERIWPRRGAAIVVRRHDAYTAWTWIALGGLIGAATLALIGVPKVDLHGPLHYLGVMDPFCGATRSVYLTLHGRLGDAARFNPVGPLLVVAAVLALSRAVVGHTTGYWAHARIPRRVWIPVAVIAIAVLEVNQQAHAALLMAPWRGA